MICRHCGSKLSLSFIDLKTSPPSNAYVKNDQLDSPDLWYPLRVMVCENCWLVQTADFTKADQLFDADYAYFSSFSSSWLSHAETYVTKMVERFGLDKASNVVEIAANDGYLLQYVKEKGIPCLGIEPTESTANAARKKGIPIIQEFFGCNLARRLASEGKSADLTAANNVLAHVPDINDFVGGFALLLKPDGVATFEFPHLLKLVSGCQFDTIYHEHYSYLSLTAVNRIFKANGLSVFDVEQLSTHGGSLRVFAQRSDTGKHALQSSVDSILREESMVGITTSGWYTTLQNEAFRIKYDFLEFLIKIKREGKTVGAYGAAAKGNTLLNWAGVRSDLLSWVADRNPAKQGKYLPGSRIPIVSEERFHTEKPDYVVILPWNLKDEIMNQLSYIRDWNGKFVTAIPSLEIL